MAQQPAIQCLPILHFSFGSDDVRSFDFISKYTLRKLRHFFVGRSNSRHVDVGQLDNPVTKSSINDMLGTDTYLVTEEPPGFAVQAKSIGE